MSGVRRHSYYYRVGYRDGKAIYELVETYFDKGGGRHTDAPSRRGYEDSVKKWQGAYRAMHGKDLLHRKELDEGYPNRIDWAGIPKVAKWLDEIGVERYKYEGITFDEVMEFCRRVPREDAADLLNELYERRIEDEEVPF